jgi:hypothetical protein
MNLGGSGFAWDKENVPARGGTSARSPLIVTSIIKQIFINKAPVNSSFALRYKPKLLLVQHPDFYSYWILLFLVSDDVGGRIPHSDIHFPPGPRGRGRERGQEEVGGRGDQEQRDHHQEPRI